MGAGGGGSAVCVLEVSETRDVAGKRCFIGSRSRRERGREAPASARLFKLNAARPIR